MVCNTCMGKDMNCVASKWIAFSPLCNLKKKERIAFGGLETLLKKRAKHVIVYFHGVGIKKKKKSILRC